MFGEGNVVGLKFPEDGVKLYLTNVENWASS
jgi:hypothetical protein